jgi:endoribonuclease LACTB2
MSASIAPTIVNVGYRSTNFWVVSAGRSRLLIDLGWPGTLDQMRAALDRMGVPLAELRCGFATHYHIDHAGLAQDLKLLGLPLLVADVQVEWIARLADHIKPADKFTPITLHDNRVIALSDSRSVLAEFGIDGELLHTPGHSPDSVSVLLDNGAVFTGDLTHPQFITEAEAAITEASWQLLRDRGAKRVHGGHGPVWTL